MSYVNGLGAGEQPGMTQAQVVQVVQELTRQFAAFKQAWQAAYPMPIALVYGTPSWLQTSGDTTAIGIYNSAMNSLAMVERGVERVKAGEIAHAPAVAQSIRNLTAAMGMPTGSALGVAVEIFVEFLQTLPQRVGEIVGKVAGDVATGLGWKVGLGVALALVGYKVLDAFTKKHV